MGPSLLVGSYHTSTHVNLIYLRLRILYFIFDLESDGYRKMMEDREEEIMALSGSDERWENWMQYVQSRMLPRFTEHGYDVIDTPTHIQAKLKAMIDKAVKDFDNLPIEAGEGSIYGPYKPKFVELGEIRLVSVYIFV